MRWINAIKDGLLCGRRGVLGACIFYLEALLLSSLALAPLASGLHRVLDETPTAAPLAMGAGVDRLLETAINQPGLWSAGFGNLGVAFLLHLGLALLITAGATGLIARAPEGSPWRAFWREASGLFFPFAGLFLMSLLLLVAVGILPSLLVAGLGKALKESVSPAAFWGVLSGWVIVFLLLLAVFKGATGFTQARRALGCGAEGLGRCFLGGAKFSLKKFVPSFGFTAFFLVLRMATFSGLYWAVAPSYGTAGNAFVSALLLQLAFAAQAYIRVAEIAAQVSYLKAAGGAYVPPVEAVEPPAEAPPEPEASPEAMVTA
jgi:hypothetical protein